MPSLSDIVSAALTDADHGMKIASASDVPEESAGSFDELLGIPSNDTEEPAAPQEETSQEKTSRHEALADASYAMKLAEALDRAGDIWSKVATSPIDRPGPAVMQSEHQEASQHPSAQSPASASAAEASHGGGPTEQTQGNPNGIRTNKADYTSPDWTKNKEAALSLLMAKTAQAEQLMDAGEVDQAERIIAEAEQIQAKLAADPSSPQASLPTGGGVPKLDTEPGPAGHMPDNAGMISMTRSSARDKTTREASEYFMSAPKQDNAVAAHVGRTDGLKVSSLMSAVEKRAADGEKTHTKSRMRRFHESRPAQMGGLGVSGALGGGAAGALTGPQKPKQMLMRGAAGALLGGALGTGVGTVSAPVNRKMYSAVDKMRGSKGVDPEPKDKKKESSLDPTQLAAARVYLQKQAAKATDPNSTMAEKRAALEIIETVKERLGEDQISALFI